MWWLTWDVWGFFSSLLFSYFEMLAALIFGYNYSPFYLSHDAYDLGWRKILALRAGISLLYSLWILEYFVHTANQWTYLIIRNLRCLGSNLLCEYPEPVLLSDWFRRRPERGITCSRLLREITWPRRNYPGRHGRVLGFRVLKLHQLDDYNVAGWLCMNVSSACNLLGLQQRIVQTSKPMFCVRGPAYLLSNLSGRSSACFGPVVKIASWFVDWLGDEVWVVQSRTFWKL